MFSFEEIDEPILFFFIMNVSLYLGIFYKKEIKLTNKDQDNTARKVIS